MAPVFRTSVPASASQATNADVALARRLVLVDNVPLAQAAQAVLPTVIVPMVRPAKMEPVSLVAVPAGTVPAARLVETASVVNLPSFRLPL